MATTSSGTITTSNVNGTTRITGLSSGVDVDSIVQQLMEAEKQKVYKMQQDEDKLEWKQEAYRSVMSDANTFSSKYLSTTAAGSIIKESTFLQHEATSDSTSVTVAANSDASTGSHTISVSQLATAQTIKSKGAAVASAAPSYSSLSGDTWTISVGGTDYTVDLSSVTSMATLQTAVDVAVDSGSTALGANRLQVGVNSSGYLTLTAIDGDITSFSAGVQTDLGFSSASGTVTNVATKPVQGNVTSASYAFASGTTWKITLDGTDRTVDLTNVTDVSSLQTAIDTAVGSGKLNVAMNSTGLAITAVDAGVKSITVAAQSTLGFTSGGTGVVLSNRLSTSDTLETIASKLNTSFSFGQDTTTDTDTDADELSFTINGVAFTFDKSDTLAAMMSTINKSDAGITMSYDSVNDNLSIVSKNMGSGTTLTIADGTSVVSNGGTFISSILKNNVAGMDAKLTLDGNALTRSSNTVTVDGVTYTLNKVTASEVTVNVTQDTESAYDAVTNFVTAYNALITEIKGKLDENYDSDYAPLTATQKSSMDDDEITAWEKKAKVGLLESDDLLQDFLDELRETFLKSVPGTDLNLKAIGITSSSYDEYGKLTIDEATLKAAIQNDPEGVKDLFTQRSTSYDTTAVRSLSSAEQAVRYNEEGYGMRFYDVFQKYYGTTRDSGGLKGLLVEKAGLKDDASEDDNSLKDQLDDLKERIDKEEDRLSDVQERYYSKYTYMETYINNLSTQMAAFTSNTSS